MSQKIYVLDTSVLLSAGKQALTSFEDNEIVLPLTVISELEKKRNEEQSPGAAAAARSVIREIEKLRAKGGDLTTGVPVNPDGGTLRVEINHVDRTPLQQVFPNNHSNDVRILAVAYNLQTEESEKKAQGKEYKQVVFLTRDLPLRIQADIVTKNSGLIIQPYLAQGVLYKGITDIYVSSQLIADLNDRNNHSIEAPAEFLTKTHGAQNYAFRLLSYENSSHTGLCYMRGQRLFSAKSRAYDSLQAKSAEQKIALSYLYDENLSIVSLGGPAGTGKTMLSLVAGIEHALERKSHPDGGKYRRVVVFRPLYSVGGQELGFLPGGQDEKMEPWVQAVYDSIEGQFSDNVIEDIKARNMLEVIPVTHIRGRTLNDSYIVVDEAQNFEPNVLLTILSRLGKNSKIVFLWDATQKDNVNLGYNDGIISVIDHLKGHDVFAHVSLHKSERSYVATIAAEILEEYIG